MALPEIRIPWWNKKEQKVEYAVIQAKQLVVKDTPVKTGNNDTTSAPLTDPGTPAVPSTTNTTSSGPAELNKPLLALCAFLVLAWLVTIYMLLRTRQQVAALVGGGQAESKAAADLNEAETFGKLGRACRSNDPVRARKAVIDWARAYRPDRKVQTSADLEREYPDSDLTALLGEIDNILYNQNDGSIDWHGKSLLEAVESIRKSGARKKKRRSSLQELYK